ncbi:Uncharacterised protein [Phocoenobacter uteri]|uniref:Uncharacterized protein n=1 Tax=Phocoenobacter uteri TaxID=146806 RepID=A0A379CDC9_9PAST|nr:hypothetical protein [Phocoenobacter uteri]SUB59677.1 Uncharacterised protein [Phocoenobacter uteri]
MIAHFLLQEMMNAQDNKKVIQRMRLLGVRFDIKVVTLTQSLPCLYL